jgi:transcriptional regulator with XRE-family HTH domain
MTETATVGNVIKQARRALGLTQEELAHSLGLSVITVSRWERDVQRPSLLDCSKLAKKLSSIERPFVAEDFAA